jgi:2-amino-4-hydroxy-6-hydroxymethyldihydropteridine diphosphokinase
MPLCILSLGSNLEPRLARLNDALAALRAHPRIRAFRASPVYESEPQKTPDPSADPWFLNCVAAFETDLTPRELLALAHELEAQAGRVRTGVYGAPRPLDIDLIDCGGLRLESPGLTLPHPRALERRFVLVPLADLLPEHRLPGTDRPVRELAAALPKAGQSLRRLA